MVRFPIRTDQAQRDGLLGSETYRYSAFIYFDDVHRDWGAVSLNSEAYRAFTDTIEISERAALASHRAAIKEWIERGAIAAGLEMPWSAPAHDTLEYVNYEHLKLACGFELHLKARLLARGFVVHRLEATSADYRKLTREQEDRPITVAELFAISGFQFDGRQNFLPGIKTQSLKFSWLTDRPAYRAASGLASHELDIIRDYRELRNQIHLPGEYPETPAIHAFGAPIIDFLIPFIQSEIVEWSNVTIKARGFALRCIPQFT